MIGVRRLFFWGLCEALSMWCKKDPYRLRTHRAPWDFLFITYDAQVRSGSSVWVLPKHFTVGLCTELLDDLNMECRAVEVTQGFILLWCEVSAECWLWLEILRIGFVPILIFLRDGWSKRAVSLLLYLFSVICLSVCLSLSIFEISVMGRQLVSEEKTLRVKSMSVKER